MKNTLPTIWNNIRITVSSLLIVILLCIPSPIHAKPIDADLDVRSVDIDHNFSGMELLLYGARNDIGRIIIVLRGPDKRYLVRKKEKIAGIWVNRKSVEFEPVPAFYAAASTNPIQDIQNNQLLSILEIGQENITIPVAENQQDIKSEKTVAIFRKELLEHFNHIGLYHLEFAPVNFMGKTLFRTWLDFPKNLVGGMYTAEVYLFADGKLTAVQTIPIKVEKIGFEALMHAFAHQMPVLYGLISVLMAIIAGWGGNKILRRG